MSTRIKVFARIGGVFVLAGDHRRDRRLGRPQRRVPAAGGVPARGRGSTSTRRVDLQSTARPLPARSPRPHGGRDALHRQAHAGAAQPRADRGRVALRAHARQHHARATWTTRWRAKWFPFIGTLFLFIWFSNLHRLHPAADEHARTSSTSSGSRSRRSRSTRRRRTSRSRSSLTLIVWFTLPRRGHPGQGLPSSTSRAGSRRASTGPRMRPIFLIEVISHFVRLISLSASDSSPTSSPATC